MGIASTYCGWIYNDFASVPLQTFGPSCYLIKDNPPNAMVLSVRDPDCVYPVGVDPAWYMSKSELTYLNSLKMKLAVILGVAQMSLGVVLKGFNYHF